MPYIKVDHSRFEAAANAIDTYVKSLKNNMNSAKSEVNTMLSTWQGSDATVFKSKWDELTAADSTYKEMIKALETYADYLRFCAKEYKKAQTNAINRAEALPKW